MLPLDIDPKPFHEITLDDFDRFILKMKERGAGNCRIAQVIAAMKWVMVRLEERGQTSGLDLAKIKKPRVTKKETNYLTETEVEYF